MKLTFKPNKLGIAVILLIIIIALATGYKKRKKVQQIAMQTFNYLKEKTWDLHTNRRIALLHPAIIGKVKEFIIRADKELGIKLRITAGLRTWQEQSNLYAQGRTKAGNIVTWAKAGQSYHNYGLAIDVVEIKNGKALWNNPNWEQIALLGESIGFTWGGRWTGGKKDKPHFQLTFGKHHSELAQLYQNGNRSGEYVNIT